MTYIQYPGKYIFQLSDGHNEPIKYLDGASRLILINEETVGVKDITLGLSRFEPKTSIHKKHSHSDVEEIMYVLSGKGITGIKE